ncbi:MAG: hypothetical protein WCA22_22290 [Candidatus Binatus sp.]
MTDISAAAYNPYTMYCYLLPELLLSLALTGAHARRASGQV